AAREADCKGIGIKAKAGFLLHLFEELVLSEQMGRPDFFRGQAEDVAQREVVFAPSGNVAVENVLHGRTSPSGGVDAIGDGFDVRAGEHAAGDLSVQLGDAVDIGAETEGKVRHIDGSAAAGGFLQIGKIRFSLENAAEQIGGGGVL